MEDEKFRALAALVREARLEEKRTVEAMRLAEVAWKEQNRILTERIKVLDDYVKQQVSEHTAA